ncbi:MAG: c-type cytochrome [Bacteriovoracaceae bacterium]
MNSLVAVSKTMICLIFPLVVSLSDASAQNIERGKTLFASCVACHGQNGEGTDKAPKLAGQHDWYLESSFNTFKIKERPSAGGAHEKVSAADAKDIAAFLASLK